MLLRTCLVSLVLLAMSPLAAVAKPVFGLELTGSRNWYDMNVFNDSLRSFNDVTGTAFGDISDGAGWGGNLRLWPNERVLLRVGLQNWSATTKDRGYTFDVSTWSFQGGLTYFFDTGMRPRIGIGVGFDNLSLHGGFEGPEVKLDGGGTGFSGHGTVEGMIPIRNGWSGIVTLGYRFAKVDALQLAEQATSAEPDYSGPYLQIGLAFDAFPLEGGGR